jgi:hypothetical protein
VVTIQIRDSSHGLSGADRGNIFRFTPVLFFAALLLLLENRRVDTELHHVEELVIGLVA